MFVVAHLPSMGLQWVIAKIAKYIHPAPDFQHAPILYSNHPERKNAVVQNKISAFKQCKKVSHSSDFQRKIFEFFSNVVNHSDLPEQ